MGLLSFFSKSNPQAGLARLPSGSFTVDPKGHVVASTLPQSIPPGQIKAMTELVLGTFRSAQGINLVMTELQVEYGSFKIKAKELRGGAMIFLTPKQLGQK